MKHNYHERKQNRIDYAKEQAAKNEQKAKSLHKQADDIARYIPPGQPILVGHHSEGRHRRDIERMNNAMRSSVEADKKADYYEDKADSIESNSAISSDDPDALAKLRAQLVAREKKQALMKMANKHVRKGDKQGFLTLPGGTESAWEELTRTGRFGGPGFAQFELTNNNASIKRIKARIAELEKAAARTTQEDTIKGVRLVENAQANRVQLIFSNIPPKTVRDRLKKDFAFRWSPSEGAWQRHLNDSGIYAAKAFLKTYTAEPEN